MTSERMVAILKLALALRGVLVGLGLEEKYSIALFGFGIVIGLVLTEQRRALWSKWMWFGGLAALLIFLPNLIWNAHYHWPFLQLMHAIRAAGRDVVLGPFDYFFQQTLLLNPLTSLIWLTGLLALLFSARLRPYRLLGWSYLVSYAVFFVLHGKNYYLAPIYPMLLASGAVVIESALDREKITGAGLQWLKPEALLQALRATFSGGCNADGQTDVRVFRGGVSPSNRRVWCQGQQHPQRMLLPI